MLLDQLGFYGKLPGKGDFVRRALPNDMMLNWDNWLQSAMAHSRAELGSEWLNHYLVSPIWRFALSPGLLGSQGLAGILMPSVDSVGRHFPLTLAQPIAPNCDLTNLALQADQWFEQLEDLALYALSDTFSMSDFEQRMTRLAAPPPIKQPKAVSSVEGRMGWHQDSPDGSEMVAQCLAAELQTRLNRDYASISLWWTLGSQDIEPALLIYPALPPPASFSAFISGRW
ncbi:type VI secretion system-associated protein TagF [Bowmanella denitrificans]|uniref:Type VI secretion system-associated protein TagF n=1 Tax=Bowmanella denitrificans TaxID=366582 RepID=A0ABP3H1P2_9ALTE|nr:type VI secretion system-associated protein TagF [Bowmanella denitrificans]